jgi:hypothetical protein
VNLSHIKTIFLMEKKGGNSHIFYLQKKNPLVIENKIMKKIWMMTKKMCNQKRIKKLISGKN